MTMLNKIDAVKAKALLDSGKAVLVDIRESDEFAREHVPGAHHLPLSGFSPEDFPQDRGKIAIFHCASGARTAGAAPQILGTGFAEIYQLDQGLSGWKKAGLATVVNRSMPIPIQRLVLPAVRLRRRRPHLRRRFRYLRHGEPLGRHALES